MSKAKTVSKPAAATAAPVKPAAAPVATSTAAQLAAAAAAPVTAAPNAAATGKAALPNVVTATGAELRPHHCTSKPGNPAKLPSGSVSITAKGAALKPGGVSFNAMAWAAIQAALASGTQSAAQLAAAVTAATGGSGAVGIAHINYRVKGGWLAVAA
jgi:hypothetical protein